MNIAGNTVFIPGSTSGIGLALAVELHARGNTSTARPTSVEICGERARPNTMVLIEEVADGGWGIGDNVLTRTMLNASDI